MNVVDCADPHQYEIYALPTHPAGPDEEYPGDREIGEFGDDECLGETFEDYVGVAYETSELLAFVLQPTEETWEAAGDREFICSVYLEGEELEGSVEGSERCRRPDCHRWQPGPGFALLAPGVHEGAALTGPVVGQEHREWDRVWHA